MFKEVSALALLVNSARRGVPQGENRPGCRRFVFNVMARFGRLLSFIGVLFFIVNTAWAEPIESEEGQIALVAEAQPQSQVEEIELALVAVEDSQQEILVQTPKGKVYKFPLHPTNEPDQILYESLTETEQKDFQVNRLFFLVRLATLLEKTGWAVGSGSLIKNKLKQIFRKEKTDQAFQNLARDSLESEGELKWRDKIKKRSEEITHHFLQITDRYLWSQSKIVAKQNEISFTASVGVIAEGGVKEKGFGGSFALGINLGYNKDRQALVFEIYTEAEAFRKAFVPTFMIATVPKVGYLMKMQNEDEDLKSRLSMSFYPPVVPSYITSSSEMFVVGFNTSLLSFPPFIGDYFSYLNSNKRTPIIRLSFSSMTKPFVGIKILGQQKVRAYVQPISNYIKEIDDKVRASNFYKKCEALLSKKVF